MKKVVLLITMLALFSCFAFSDDGIRATTEDGKQVILNSDGSWKFLEGQALPISFSKFDVVKRDADVDSGRYSNDALLVLTIKNETDKIIKAYRLTIEVRNAFGDVMHTIKLTSGDSMIYPQETEDASFKFDDNQFIDDEVYDSLTAYSIDNLSLTIIDAQAVYKD